MIKLSKNLVLGLLGVGATQAVMTANKAIPAKAAALLPVAGAIALMVSNLDNKRNKTNSDDNKIANTEQEIRKLSTPLSSNTKKDVALRKQEEALAAPLRTTLQFSEDVKQATDEKMVRATGRPFGRSLPELSVKKEYSPLSNNLVLNVNALKSKVEKLETKTFLHTSMLMGMKRASNTLNTRAKEDIKEYDQSVVNLERVRDEENLEGAGLDNRFNKLVEIISGSKIFRKGVDAVSGLRDTFISFAKSLMIPTALIALGVLAKFIAKDSDKEYDIINEIASSVLGISAGIMKTLGFGPGAVLGIQKKSPPIPKRQIPSVRGTISEIRNRITGVDEPTTERATRIRSMATHKMVVQQMRKHLEFLKKLRIPFLGNVVGLVAGILIIDTMLTIITRFEKNELSEEEYTALMKAEISKLLSALGGGFFGGYLGVVFGAKVGVWGGARVGSLITPGVGTVVGGGIGGTSGVIIGGLAGAYYGTKLFNSLGKPLDFVVNAVFEHIIGDDTALYAILMRMIQAIPYTNDELIEKGYSTDMSPADMIIRSSSDLDYRMIMDPRTGEMVRSDYYIRKKQNVDERGILTALSRVRTPEEYKQIKREMEELLLDGENFEDFLRESLNDEEFQYAITSLMNNIIKNPAMINREQEVADFLDSLIIDDVSFKTLIGQDALDIIRRGEGVPVRLSDGSLTVMTIEEIQNLSIPEAQRVRLLEQAEDQRKKYESVLGREARSNRLITEEDINNTINDEMFRNAPQLRTSPDNSQASIVPVVMPMDIGGMGDMGTGIETGASRETNPMPSSYTSDSFLQTGFGALA